MDENTKLLMSIKKGIVVNRIIGIVGCVFAIATFVVMVIVGMKVNEFVKEVSPAIEALSQIDVDEFNATLKTVNQAVDLLKIDEIMNTLNGIDFEGFNEIINNIDIDKFNDTMNNLNSAYEQIQEITEKMKPITSFFGKQ